MSLPSRTLLGLVAALLLAGCYDEASYDALEGAEDGVPDDFLRVDVYPSDRNAALLPQSHWVDGWWYDADSLEIDMSTPVTIAGTITASEPLDGVLSSETGRGIPVQASVSAWVEGTIMAASTTSEATSGAYALSLPPQEGWDLAVVPVDGSTLPFSVISDQDIAFDRPDWHHQLSDGARVRGVILREDGEPAADVQVRAVHTETGVAGPAVLCDTTGAFSLRLAPDRYTLQLGGVAGSGVPTSSIEIEAELDEIQEVGLTLGSLDGVPTSGRVVDAASNRPVEGVSLSFVSHSLDDHPGATLALEATTDSTGAWELPLLPGSWRMELVPPAEERLSPRSDRLEVFADEGELSLGALALEPYRSVQAVVRTPGGEPAEGVTVVASESAISGRTFTAVTDAAGSFRMEVPASPLHLVLNPGDSSAAVTHIDVEADGFPTGMSLALGRLLTGRVVHEGEPVQAALVEVRDASTELLYATTLTDSQGAFELRLAADTAQLTPGENDSATWDTGYLD